MQIIPINTKYLKGEYYILPFDYVFFNHLLKMKNYARDEWGRNHLKENNIKVRSNCYTSVLTENGKILRARITNTDYKLAAYR